MVREYPYQRERVRTMLELGTDRCSTACTLWVGKSRHLAGDLRASVERVCSEVRSSGQTNVIGYHSLYRTYEEIGRALSPGRAPITASSDDARGWLTQPSGEERWMARSEGGATAAERELICQKCCTVLHARGP